MQNSLRCRTPLRQVAIFLHNADFPHLRVTKPPPNSPAKRCCFALGIGSVRGNSNDCNAGRKEVDSVREKTYNHKYIQVTGKGEGMVLFYGSKEIVVYPSIRKSIYNRDFYFGFYCTANKEQAERCAIRYIVKRVTENRVNSNNSNDLSDYIIRLFLPVLKEQDIIFLTEVNR
jgi:hypothetical protein